MLKGEGDSGNQLKRISALNDAYDETKKKMESMASAAEKLEKLNNYEIDLAGKHRFEEEKVQVQEVEQAVRDLIKAQNNYRAAKMDGDDTEASRLSKEVDAAR